MISTPSTAIPTSSEDLSKLTVAVLKQYCRDANLKIGGNVCLFCVFQYFELYYTHPKTLLFDKQKPTLIARLVESASSSSKEVPKDPKRKPGVEVNKENGISAKKTKKSAKQVVIPAQEIAIVDTGLKDLPLNHAQKLVVAFSRDTPSNQDNLGREKTAANLSSQSQAAPLKEFVPASKSQEKRPSSLKAIAKAKKGIESVISGAKPPSTLFRSIISKNPRFGASTPTNAHQENPHKLPANSISSPLAETITHRKPAKPLRLTFTTPKPQISLPRKPKYVSPSSINPHLDIHSSFLTAFTSTVSLNQDDQNYLGGIHKSLIPNLTFPTAFPESQRYLIAKRFVLFRIALKFAYEVDSIEDDMIRGIGTLIYTTKITSVNYKPGHEVCVVECEAEAKSVPNHRIWVLCKTGEIISVCGNESHTRWQDYFKSFVDESQFLPKPLNRRIVSHLDRVSSRCRSELHDIIDTFFLANIENLKKFDLSYCLPPVVNVFQHEHPELLLVETETYMYTVFKDCGVIMGGDDNMNWVSTLTKKIAVKTNLQKQ